MNTNKDNLKEIGQWVNSEELSHKDDQGYFAKEKRYSITCTVCGTTHACHYPQILAGYIPDHMIKCKSKRFTVKKHNKVVIE